MNYQGPLYRLYHYLASIPPKISFKKTKNVMSEEDRAALAKLLANGYYIILTGNKYHLSSIFVRIMTLLKTGHWSPYSHALMNCDFIDDPNDWKEFKFMEATATGVHYSTSEEVFDCSSVCVLTPKNIDNQEWTRIIDALIKQNGKPYDDLFQLSDSTHISCVELVRNALMANDTYNEEFKHFEHMIRQEGNLVPHMFRECSDFEVVYEDKDFAQYHDTRRTN